MVLIIDAITVQLTVIGVPDTPGIAASILSPIGAADIDIDMIIQNIGLDGTTDFTFTVNREEYIQAFTILENISKQLTTVHHRAPAKRLPWWVSFLLRLRIFFAIFFGEKIVNAPNACAVCGN